MPNKIDHFWQELKRRKVIRTIPVYFAVSFAIIDGVSNIFPRFNMPDWTIKLVIFLLAIGFIIFLITSWIYDLTPKGIEKTLPRSEVTEPIEEKPSHTNAWKITTFLSIVLIIFLAISNVSKSKKIRAEKQPALSIAVLPLEPLSADKEQTFFSEMITDVIIGQLAKIKTFRVLGRTSTVKYSDGHKTITEIGKELKVSFVLEGTIYKVGDSILISLQLLRTSNEGHVWSELYDMEYTKILDIQIDIANKVANSLKTVLSPEEKTEIEKKPTLNTIAWDYYLRGNYNLNKKKYDEKDIRNAIKMYQKAIYMDSAFAMAYASLGRAYTTMYYMGYDPSTRCLEKSKVAIDAAFALDPDLPEAHIAYGLYYYYGFLDFNKSLEQLDLVLKKQPDNPAVLYYKYVVLRRQGKWQKCEELTEKVVNSDPMNALTLNNIAITYDYLRNYRLAQTFYERAIVLRPDWSGFYTNKVLSFVLWKGETKEAWRLIEEAIPLTGDEFLKMKITLSLLDGNYDQTWKFLIQTPSDVFDNPAEKFLVMAQVLDLLQKKEESRNYFDSARICCEKKLQETPDDPFLQSNLGIAYAGLNQKEKAIEYGLKALESKIAKRDAIFGPDFTENLARIYVMTGEYDEAMKKIEYLLSKPSHLSVNLVRIDPVWTPLIKLPAFEKLEKNYLAN